MQTVRSVLAEYYVEADNSLQVGGTWVAPRRRPMCTASSGSVDYHLLVFVYFDWLFQTFLGRVCACSPCSDTSRRLSPPRVGAVKPYSWLNEAGET